jgi:hypothetical protein
VSLFLPRSSGVVAEDIDPLAAIPKLNEPATILIVEDDPEVRRTSVAMVQDLGHHILIARNAGEALAIAPALKVMITTGYPGHADLLRNDFAVLAKPFTRLDLELMIRSLIEHPMEAVAISPGLQPAAPN